MRYTFLFIYQRFSTSNSRNSRLPIVRTVIKLIIILWFFFFVLFSRQLTFVEFVFIKILFVLHVRHGVAILCIPIKSWQSNILQYYDDTFTGGQMYRGGNFKIVFHGSRFLFRKSVKKELVFGYCRHSFCFISLIFNATSAIDLIRISIIIYNKINSHIFIR